MNITTTGHELLNEAREIREQLAALGGNERLLAKIDSMLALTFTVVSKSHCATGSTKPRHY